MIFEICAIIAVILYFAIMVAIPTIAKHYYKCSDKLVFDLSFWSAFWPLTIWRVIPRLIKGRNGYYKDGIPLEDLL